MRAHRLLPYIALLAAICGTAVGCSKGPSEEELKLAQLKEQSATIQQLGASLKQARADLAEARAAIAEIEAVPEQRRSDEQKAKLAELTPRVAELTTAQDTAFEQLQTALAEFLNVAINDFPDLPETTAALDLYADEAILVAEDMVAKAGDYKKATDHLVSASSLFDGAGLPPYQPLKDRIVLYEEWRFITKERFDAVKNKMTRDEVKQLVGVPYYQNVKVEEQRDIETWLYRKREGGAAAIFFRLKTGTVYGKEFDAVKVQVTES